jgi:hypothetical protein
MVTGDNKINDKKYTSNAGNFNCHVDAAVRCGAHHPMEHIPGFTRSHWMPQLGEYLHRIAAIAAMVNEFVVKHQNTNKTQFLASNYGTNQYEKFVPPNGLSTQLINATSFD